MCREIKTMKELIDKINEANDAYYLRDAPIMSDKEYDGLCDELEDLEKQTGLVMSNSPLHKVQGKVLEGFKKVKHTKPMLSAQKTKDIDEIGKFIGDKQCVESWKLDGLTIVARYKHGKFVQAVTRGNSEVGEDVTETFKHCINLPLQLSQNVDIEVRGECVISWSNFKKINEGLEEPYSHPRNLAAGSIRCLDTNIIKQRYLEYKVFELVEVSNIHLTEAINWNMYEDGHMDVASSFSYMTKLGFDVVENTIVTNADYKTENKYFNPENCEYPVDGVIFKYNNYEYGKSLGVTAHHPNDMMALKWKDEVVETTLIDVEWQVGKTGTITPVAVFKPVEIDGTIIEKATLHNLLNFKKLRLAYGDTISIYKANSVIPQVYENLSAKERTAYDDVDWIVPPLYCPMCGGRTSVTDNGNSVFLTCTNPECKGQFLGKLTHFVSKNAMNIDGLSEQSLKMFIEEGLVECFEDIYDLPDYYDTIRLLEGFGDKSADKLVKAIEFSRDTTLDRFIYALSIPLIGRTASKTVAKAFDYDIDKFIKDAGWIDFSRMAGFGKQMHSSINEYMYDNKQIIENLAARLNFEKPKSNVVVNDNINGKTFVITGSLNKFKNRDEVKNIIENLGGKVTGSVSAKTDYLINNDIQSSSGKNKKAKELNVPIVNEDWLIEMMK